MGAAAAVLNATVNPNGEPVTACTFEYGPSTAYGSSQSCTLLPGSANAPVAVSASLAGLAARASITSGCDAPGPRSFAGRALDGRYELHAVLGEGAFGRAHRGARHAPRASRSR